MPEKQVESRVIPGTYGHRSYRDSVEEGRKKPTQNVGLAIGSIGAVDKSGRADLEWSHNTKMRGENV